MKEIEPRPQKTQKGFNLITSKPWAQIIVENHPMFAPISRKRGWVDC